MAASKVPLMTLREELAGYRSSAPFAMIPRSLLEQVMAEIERGEWRMMPDAPFPERMQECIVHVVASPGHDEDFIAVACWIPERGGFMMNAGENDVAVGVSHWKPATPPKKEQRV